jgi:adenine-specific DNA-methyltransferase
MCSFIHNKKLSILEPSCGEGAFLEHLSKNKNYIIDANDINTTFISTCKKAYKNVIYTNTDFIGFENNKKYDIVIGNPPYIRIQNLSEDNRNIIKNEFDLLTGNIDIFMYFIMKSLSLLNDTGKLIFIIPNSFLYTKSCSKLKDYLFSSNLVEYLIDFKDKKIFNGISTYTCILVLNKSNTNTFYYYANDILGKYTKVNYNTNTKTNSLLKYINIRCGLATLCDNVFIIKSFTEDNTYIYPNEMFKIEKSILKQVLKVSKNKIYYIIYPYIDGVILDNLNEYPECEKYLLHHKNALENRDKGNKKYEKWYAYGRKQGILLSNTNRLFISSLTKDMDLFEHNIPLFYSGLYIESTINIETLNVLLHKYKKDIFQNSNVKSGGWYSINKNSFDIQISEIF